MSPDDVAALPSRETDVLVIGGGPAGAAMGYWLAERGHQVAVVERKHFP
ncbi:MAG: FAD-dependent oxidoreductase, partial [Acidimicrobiia bacterium]|nr:FAD-dependent oxidoreductase [Acidimicrobiia bacterium]